MKNTIFNLIKGLTFLIIVGIFIFTFFRYCNPPQPEEIIIKDITKISRKNYIPVAVLIPHKKTSAPIAEERPIDNSRDSTYKDTMYIHDTIWAYNDYLATRVYKDTLLDDSSGFVFVLDTVTLNKIVSRSYDIRLINTTKIIQDSKGHFYLGVGSQINDNISLSVNGYFQKKNYLVGLGYNTNKQFMLNYSYKIK